MAKGLRFAYYPGCVAQGSAREVEDAMQGLSRVLGLELLPMMGWCASAILVGDMIPFLLGRIFGVRLLRLRWLRYVITKRRHLGYISYYIISFTIRNIKLVDSSLSKKVDD